MQNFVPYEIPGMNSQYLASLCMYALIYVKFLLDVCNMKLILLYKNGTL